MSPQQVELLKRWIDEGARWGKHWSLTPALRPALPEPEIERDGWARNGIDRRRESGIVFPARGGEWPHMRTHYRWVGLLLGVERCRAVG